nr:TrkA family potassium uptake protein [Actinomycetota bacterium]
MDGFSVRRFAQALAAVVVLLVLGTFVFHSALDLGIVDSAYRTLVTISLTGVPADPGGTGVTLFTGFLLLAGVALFAYVASALVELIARGVLGDAYGHRRRRRAIDRLRGHTIICGYGRVGRRVAAELRAGEMDYVVVDVNADALEAAQADGSLVVLGDGTEDADLERAGILRARGLVASADSDEINLFITLSAKAIRSDIFVVARGSDEGAARKLKLAGADRVVQPYSSAGLQMANLIAKPQVAAFLDVVSMAGGADIQLEEIEIPGSCQAAGNSIRKLRVRDRTGAIIVALRKRDGTFDTTPSPDAMLEAGDVLIGVGTTEELHALEELFAPEEI